MRCVLQFSMVPILLSLLASQADARSGRGGFFGGIVIGTSVAHISRQFIARRRPVIPAQRVRASSLQRLRQRSLAQNGFPIGGIWPGLGWPDTTQDVATPAIDEAAQQQLQPEVIIIHSDAAAHTASEPAPDFGYIPGCHAIPSGYHCDTPVQ
jgi:hypothetical protein